MRYARHDVDAFYVKQLFTRVNKNIRCKRYIDQCYPPTLQWKGYNARNIYIYLHRYVLCFCVYVQHNISIHIHLSEHIIYKKHLLSKCFVYTPEQIFYQSFNKEAFPLNRLNFFSFFFYCFLFNYSTKYLLIKWNVDIRYKKKGRIENEDGFSWLTRYKFEIAGGEGGKYALYL